jgi:hypothetical protein
VLCETRFMSTPSTHRHKTTASRGDHPLWRVAVLPLLP